MSKISTLHEAVASIPSGSHIALPGFAITRCAMAFAHEVIRQQIDHLTLSQCVGAMDADILAGAGLVDRFIYGGGSLDRFGRLANVNRGIENHTLDAQEYSSLSVTFRYLAGALGIPFIPIRSLRGSDLLAQLEEKHKEDVAMVVDPFKQEDWLALRPLVPDVTIVQAQVSDEEGNAWILGPRWDNAEQVKAGKRTIVITERLVSTEAIRREPEKTVVPGFVVSHVVELSFGAFPTSVFGAHDYDAEHIQLYVKASTSQESFKAYLDEFVFSAKDHWDFLDKIGGFKRLNSLKADPILGY